MRTFVVKLVKKEAAAADTTAFYFEKPAGFSFKAGQYCKISLINQPVTDIKGNTRSFSFASSPDENLLMIVVRNRNSAFKTRLNSLKEGSEVEMLAPLTMMSLKGGGKKPLVFICGGIGVAAARSLILDAFKRGFEGKIYLFNSNSKPERTVFYNDFKTLQHNYPEFYYIPTITGSPSGVNNWPYETGYLDRILLEKYIPEPAGSIYYIAGPPKFVWDIYKIVKLMGVPDEKFNFDEFTGY